MGAEKLANLCSQLESTAEQVEQRSMFGISHTNQDASKETAKSLERFLETVK
jgi:hypothetical protein